MMHPPMVDDSLIYRTVYGSFPYADGMGRVPAVEFSPSIRLTTSNALLSTQEPFRVVLSTEGFFQVDLLTTDSNPLVYPSGWCWQVREDFRGGESYWFVLPYHDGSDISLSTIAPIPAKPPVIGISSGPRGERGPKGEPGDPGKDGTFKVWRQPTRPDPILQLVTPGDLWFEMAPPPPPVEGEMPDG